MGISDRLVSSIMNSAISYRAKATKGRVKVVVLVSGLCSAAALALLVELGWALPFQQLRLQRNKEKSLCVYLFTFVLFPKCSPAEDGKLAAALGERAWHCGRRSVTPRL